MSFLSHTSSRLFAPHRTPTFRALYAVCRPLSVLLAPADLPSDNQESPPAAPELATPRGR